MAKKFVSYLRVSTAKQGASGLGLEAQRQAVADHLAGSSSSLVREFLEIESGKHDARPKLAEAMALCRVHGAVLLIAKLDRLSRDAHFLLGLQKAGVRFVCADMPEANELTIGLLAVVAQHERQMISTRTKAALAAAKARGVKLGGDKGGLAIGRDRGVANSILARKVRSKVRAMDLMPTIAELRASGVTTLNGLARALTALGVPTPQDGPTGWQPSQVARLLRAAASPIIMVRSAQPVGARRDGGHTLLSMGGAPARTGYHGVGAAEFAVLDEPAGAVLEPEQGVDERPFTGLSGRGGRGVEPVEDDAHAADPRPSLSPR